MPSLEDQVQMSPPVNSVSTQNQLMADIANLDIRSLYNRAIHSYVVTYLYFMLGIDEQLFRGNESDWEAAGKTVGLMMVTDQITAAARRMFPQLIL
jgi:hypothetical protein